MINNTQTRAQSIANITSYGMKCILQEIVKEPGQPFGIDDIKTKHRLNRNDIINVRRQINKINKNNGAIRYIEPGRTHIVFIDDSVSSEKEIEGILSSGAAIAHADKINPTFAAKLRKNLSHLIYQTYLQTN